MSESARRFQSEVGENLLPLASFLASLATISIRVTVQDHRRIALALRAGGNWNTEQLCGVLASLLVRNPEKEEAFRQHFEQFFSLPRVAQEPYSRIDLGNALEDLRRLQKEDGERPEGAGQEGATLPQKPGTPTGRSYGLTAGVLVLLIALAATFGVMLRGNFSSQPPPERSVAPAKKTIPRSEVPAAASPASREVRSYPNALNVRFRKVLPYRARDWRDWGLAGALFSGVLGNAVWLWWIWRRNRRPNLPGMGEGLSRLFRPAKIGGIPAPLLDRETLDSLADFLGYFRSDIVGRELDIRASIEATARWGGVPCPVFSTRRQIRRVIVLEDVFAEALSWNTVAAELAAGLALRGVPLLHGFFRGIPDRFRLKDGSEVHLEDLEDDRRGHLVLVFTDGKGLAAPRADLVLETLARWPQVAWMQLEEPRAWDQPAAFAARHGLRIFPASQAGLLQVVGRFTSEMAAEPSLSTPPDRWRGLPPRPLAGRLVDHVEMLLGDSLLWAQACAMAMPPFSLGLADRLRERFHPDLPVDRRQRLVTLPGTTRDAGGLTFSLEVTAALREGFRLRRFKAAQDEVLEFIVERIQEAEPPDAASRAHQAWEWRLERLHFEQDPDRAIERLAVLSQGPLRRSIEGDLRALKPMNVGWGTERVSIPLSVRPKSRTGRRLLRGVLAGHGLASRPFLILQQRAAVFAAGSIALFLGLLGFQLVTLLSQSNLISLKTLPLAEEFPVAMQVDRRVGQNWKIFVGIFSASARTRLEFPADEGGYRLSVLSGSLSQTFLLPRGGNLEVDTFPSTTQRPCTENLPELGLTIERCLSPALLSPESPLWSPDEVRIGIQLRRGQSKPASEDSLGLQHIVPGLDTLYTIRQSSGGSFPPGSLERIANDWQPWAARLLLFCRSENRRDLCGADKVLGLSWNSTLADDNGNLSIYSKSTRKDAELRGLLGSLRFPDTRALIRTAQVGKKPPQETIGANKNPSVAAKGGREMAVSEQKSPSGREEAALAPSEREEAAHVSSDPPKDSKGRKLPPSGEVLLRTLNLQVGRYFENNLIEFFSLIDLSASGFSPEMVPLSPGLPPGMTFPDGILKGTPTEAGIWKAEIAVPPHAPEGTPDNKVILTIEVQDARCSVSGETLCGNSCIAMSKLSPVHSGDCFAIASSLKKSTAEGVDKPPPWRDESLQPRQYYRLYYEWKEDRTAVIVRSLKTASGWDRGPKLPSIALVLTANELAQRKHQFLVTDLEVHCAGGVRVASFSGAKRSVFEKLSTSDRWTESKTTDWPNSPAKSTDQALNETLGPILKQWEPICAERR
jgi:hypothetical protein